MPFPANAFDIMEGSGACNTGQAYTLEGAYMTPTTEYLNKPKIGRPAVSLADRFHPRVDKTPGYGPNGDCWEWTGGKHKFGYGMVWVNEFQKSVCAHKIAYLLAYGSLDPLLWVLHSCDNPACCNPSHLRQGTYQENIDDRTQRGRHGESRKTQCPQGHEYTVPNTIVKKGPHGMQRVCRICRDERMKQYSAKRKAKKDAMA